jgi:hypothetical protein
MEDLNVRLHGRKLSCDGSSTVRYVLSVLYGEAVLGIYPLGSLLALIRRSRIFFDDLPNVHRRREARAHGEVLNEITRGTRPRYYLQNFHYQSGGWLTDKSAELYDTQVEILFNGSANAIRRQALPQLHEVFAGLYIFM